MEQTGGTEKSGDAEVAGISDPVSSSDTASNPHAHQVNAADSVVSSSSSVCDEKAKEPNQSLSVENDRNNTNKVETTELEKKSSVPSPILKSMEDTSHTQESKNVNCKSTEESSSQGEPSDIDGIVKKSCSSVSLAATSKLEISEPLQSQNSSNDKDDTEERELSTISSSGNELDPSVKKDGISEDSLVGFEKSNCSDKCSKNDELTDKYNVEMSSDVSNPSESEKNADTKDVQETCISNASLKVCDMGETNTTTGSDTNGSELQNHPHSAEGAPEQEISTDQNPESDVQCGDSSSQASVAEQAENKTKNLDDSSTIKSVASTIESSVLNSEASPNLPGDSMASDSDVERGNFTATSTVIQEQSEGAVSDREKNQESHCESSEISSGEEPKTLSKSDMTQFVATTEEEERNTTCPVSPSHADLEDDCIPKRSPEPRLITTSEEVPELETDVAEVCVAKTLQKVSESETSLKELHNSSSKDVHELTTGKLGSSEHDSENKAVEEVENGTSKNSESDNQLQKLPESELSTPEASKPDICSLEMSDSKISSDEVSEVGSSSKEVSMEKVSELDQNEKETAEVITVENELSDPKTITKDTVLKETPLSVKNTQSTPSEKMSESTPSEKMLENTTSEKLLKNTPSEKMSENTPSEKMLENTTSEKLLESTPPEKMLENTTSEKLLENTPSENMLENTPSEKMLISEVHTDKSIEAIARADVDNECSDETIDITAQNEEDDPFFSCNDKTKETDLQMETDEQFREAESQVDVDQEKEPIPSMDVDPEREAVSVVDADQERQVSRSDIDQADHDTEERSLGSKTPSDIGEGELVIVTDDEMFPGDKATSGNDGDEELCIVPDTAPRVLTDKEKADAVEKATKGSTTPSKEDLSSGSVSKEKESPTESATSSDQGLPSLTNQSSAGTETETDKTSTASKKKGPAILSGIHVVSTASLLDQHLAQQSAESENAADKDESENAADKVESASAEANTCCQCKKVTKCKYKIKDKENTYVCEDACYTQYRKADKQSVGSTSSPTNVIRARKLDRYFQHKCGQCNKEVDTNQEKHLTWETMDFCHEECLEKYQKNFGSRCANCKGTVQPSSLGKYCVRFGYDMKQFCLASCLEDFKKGLKVCSYCQKDISAGVEGFLAPVGDKGQFKDFCSQICMEKYDQMSNNTAPPETVHECAVCANVKVVKVEVIVDSKIQKLCSEPCFAAFKFVNGIVAEQCDMCKKYFDQDKTENFSVFYDDAPHSFCCKTCMNVYILAKRKIVPCTWCKVKKYNFDMIKRVTSSGQVLMMCSLHCLSLYKVSVSAMTSKKIKCDKCGTTNQSQYHLTMSDATIRHFCTYSCCMSFQSQYSKPPIPVPGAEVGPHPLGHPRRINARRSVPVNEKDNTSKANTMPVISSVTSLAPSNGTPTSKAIPVSLSATKTGQPNQSKQTKQSKQPVQPVATETVKTIYKQQIIIKPPPPPERQNRAVQVRPAMSTKGVSCRPQPCSKETQTDDSIGSPAIIPIPVPIYIPVPMHMYTTPYPVPVPFPLPIPVPIFIPTTRNSAKGIFKEIKRIQEKIPSDPFEAEILMMAEMVAGEKKVENTDTESEDGENEPAAAAAADEEEEEEDAGNTAEAEFSPEAVDANNTFGEDMLQMALKIASELEEPPVDFEAAVTPATIAQAPAQHQQQSEQNDESEVDESESEGRVRPGRKRTLRSSGRSTLAAKRGRRSSGSDHSNVSSAAESVTPSRVEQTEKPDANMCLKFTFGVNAWKHWVTQKNTELEKAAGNNRKLKLFKTEILQLTADELNYSLCLYVKEVRKPNGSEYAPDTIYYLCLGIQQYLIENGRIENIFSDPYYEKFTECLDEVARKFFVLYNDSQFVVTRVEEEHLWESKQLGAHSPHVLLSTLMFFNTKHFNLTTVDEHMQLSFSHIMKHWKRNPNAPANTKVPGSRNVLLRFYPPQATLAGNSKKKKVYEQQENEENPLRCPVKLYEFYLSKCPESVRTRNDVFYLLPERSCVPDSPVWYSTMALGREHLQKMLHRIKMVKEINIALLNG